MEIRPQSSEIGSPRSLGFRNQTQRPCPAPAGDLCSAEAERLLAWGHAAVKRKTGQGFEDTTVHAPWGDLTAFFTGHQDSGSQECALSRQGTDDTDLQAFLRKWSGQMTHREGKSTAPTEQMSSQTQTRQARTFTVTQEEPPGHRLYREKKTFPLTGKAQLCLCLPAGT